MARESTLPQRHLIENPILPLSVPSHAPVLGFAIVFLEIPDGVGNRGKRRKHPDPSPGSST